MKLESNWKYKSLENLEKIKWPAYDSDSRLIKRTKELRKLPLNEYTIEDLRLMISQNIGLDYLVPLALERLNEDILAEGDYYKGDLLLAVVNSHKDFWINNSAYKAELIGLVNKNRQAIEREDIEISFDD